MGFQVIHSNKIYNKFNDCSKIDKVSQLVNVTKYICYAKLKVSGQQISNNLFLRSSLTPYPSLLDFWKIKFEKSMFEELDFWPAKLNFEIDFCRLKIHFIKLQTWFFKNQVEMDRAHARTYLQTPSQLPEFFPIGEWNRFK